MTEYTLSNSSFNFYYCREVALGDAENRREKLRIAKMNQEITAEAKELEPEQRKPDQQSLQKL